MRFFVFLFLAFFFSAQAGVRTYATENAGDSPRFLVHLLDYLAKDYSGAVENGKVISESEYHEQQEFSSKIAQLAQALVPLQNQPEIQAEASKLQQLVQSKATAEKVAHLAREIQSQVISLTHMSNVPNQWPSIGRGQVLYSQNCVSCHGLEGKGDGIAAKALNPKPANFLDATLMKKISPFHAFNVVRLGVPGTAMAPLPNLSDDEVWDLSFFVVSLRYRNALSDSKRPSDFASAETLLLASTSSDEKLSENFKGDRKDLEKYLIALRTHSGDDDHTGFMNLARQKLIQAQREYDAGRVDSAKSLALQAYLDGIEPIEPRIKANDPALLSTIEEGMGKVRESMDRQMTSAQVHQKIGEAQQTLDQIDATLQQRFLSPWVSFSAAFAILLREGFEAVLIILALLGVIQAAEAKRATKWVHSGWITALGCGAITWFFSGWLIGMSGASREMIEGVTSVFAVAVLLYVGFWLHRQTEIGRWKSFLNGKVKSALQGRNLLGLAAISFTAVFREAFETVLFLRTLWIEADAASRSAIMGGVASSLILVLVLSWLALNYSKKIPIRKLFSVSSVLMALLATILTGKGLHSFQETGVLGVTSFPINLKWELLGFYPTIETLISQLLIFALVMILWVYGGKPSRQNSGPARA